MRNSLLLLLLLSSCDAAKLQSIHAIDAIVADEMTGVPIRPLEDKVPGYPNLPTPAEALKLDGLETFNRTASFIRMDATVISSVGFYSRGKFYSYVQLKSDELFNVRNPKRAFANYFIEDTMREAVVASGVYPITVWDISQEFGGASAGHASHQLGLDVDIKYPYYKYSTAETVTTIDIPATWKLIRAFVATGKVQRMFIDRYIKKQLCMESLRDPNRELARETLRRVRHWPGHANHIHFRFFCPPMDKLCVPQTEPPKGTGCAD